jgi:hypothetical protein
MGIRDKLKARVRRTLDRFSGEFSTEAPDEVQRYARDLDADPNAEVLQARLNRPKTKE